MLAAACLILIFLLSFLFLYEMSHLRRDLYRQQREIIRLRLLVRGRYKPNTIPNSLAKTFEFIDMNTIPDKK